MAAHGCTAAVAPKIVPFNLADIGEAIAEVEIVEWMVAEGDTVEVGRPGPNGGVMGRGSERRGCA